MRSEPKTQEIFQKKLGRHLSLLETQEVLKLKEVDTSLASTVLATCIQRVGNRQHIRYYTQSIWREHNLRKHTRQKNQPVWIGEIGFLEKMAAMARSTKT